MEVYENWLKIVVIKEENRYVLWKTIVVIESSMAAWL